MKNNKARLITFILLLGTSFGLYAETENSLSVELFTGALAFEIGNLTEGENYFGASVYAGSNSLFGAEISLSSSSSNNGRHWKGLGVGYMRDSSDPYYCMFCANLGSYISGNYKYFYDGLEGSGFYFNSSVRISSGDGLPVFGLGYHF